MKTRLSVIAAALVSLHSGIQANPIDQIISPDAKVTQLGTGMKFTEGPVWIPKEKRLVWSDIPNSRQMQWTAKDGVSEWRKVEASNGNLLDLEGNLLSCQHGGRNVISTSLADGKITVLVDSIGGKKLNSPNDLAIKSDGTIWFTDPTYGLKGRKAEVDGKNVYHFDPKTKKITKIYTGFDMPNGIAFSPDEKRLYIADTGKVGTIRAFDVPKKPEPLGGVVFEIEVRCDGMCVDVQGNIYTTSRGGIHVFDKDGKKIGVIPTPEHPANVCFGGDDYKTLYITARKSLYSVDVKIPGAKPKGAKW